MLAAFARGSSAHEAAALGTVAAWTQRDAVFPILHRIESSTEAVGPVPLAFSLGPNAAEDQEKLLQAIEETSPTAVFVDWAEPFARAQSLPWPLD